MIAYTHPITSDIVESRQELKEMIIFASTLPPLSSGISSEQ